MDRPLHKKANECGYKKNDRGLKEQFRNGMNDDDMIAEIVEELNTTKNMTEIASEKILYWAIRIKVQRAQNALKEVTKCDKEFDTVKQSWKMNNMKDKKETWNNCKYCRSIHRPRRCTAYGKGCSRHGRMNHTEWVCKSQSRQVSKDGRKERCRTGHDMYKDNDKHRW